MSVLRCFHFDSVFTDGSESLREQLCCIFTAKTLSEMPIDSMRRVFMKVQREIGEKRGIVCDRHYSLDFFDSAEDITGFFIDMARDAVSAAGIDGTFRQYRQQILDYIHARYNKDLTMTEVAERFMFHPNYFSGAFHEMMGVSFNDYVTTLRLRDATKMLLESALSIRVISEIIGYKSQPYFQRGFK